MFARRANARPQLLSLFTALAALGDSFCRYLRYSRNPILTQEPPPAEGLESTPPADEPKSDKIYKDFSLEMPRLALAMIRKDFVAIYGECGHPDVKTVVFYGGRGHSGLTLAMLGNRILSLFTVLKHPICHAWEGLEITFCRFLRCPWALVPCLGRLGNYALSFLRFLR